MEMELMDLPTYTTSELMGFLDSPNDTYTAMEAENIVIQMERMLTMESEGTYPTLEPRGLLDSPMDIYAAMEAENIAIHMESMLAMENGQTFQSRT